MDYKDYLDQSKRRLDGMLDDLRKKNEKVFGSYGFSPRSKDGSEESPDRGVILTDTFMLSDEYGCRRDDVLAVIRRYVDDRARVGFKWFLLDLADPEVETPDNWQGIISILADFNARNSICRPGSPVPLFIIGNDSVIPMPQMANPTTGVVGGEYLDVDYRYAFEAQGDEDDFAPFMTEASYHVGRLPVPFTEDCDVKELAGYLERCSRMEDEGGMDIGDASMVSTESWIPSSKDMVADIPITKVDEECGLSVEGKLILSPTLDMEDYDTLHPFMDIERRADYLVCNLHGDDHPQASSYYGEDINHSFMPTGFDIGLLSENAPRIIISTACFGARFIDYACDDSMLLSAFANGTFLFVGSCVTSLGNPEGAAFSEYLTKLLNVYLHQGMPAGKAFSKAKEDYYRERSSEDDPVFALFTNLEFNLFGNPALTMKAKLPKDYVPKGVRIGGRGAPTYKAFKNTVLVRKGPDAHGDILSQVRAEVDRGLERISNTIQEELYDRIGLRGLELDSIIEYDTGPERGYYYTFDKHYDRFNTKAIVKTDLGGAVKRIILTK